MMPSHQDPSEQLEDTMPNAHPEVAARAAYTVLGTVSTNIVVEAMDRRETASNQEDIAAFWRV